MPSQGDGQVPDRGAIRNRAQSERYDVAIVGGGIAGAGIARDAAMRGFSTLLVEQHDFGSGTTAGSTRLIHGGLRYLEQFDFRLVFESLRERETLARLAPHLVDPLTFILPQYDESRRSRAKLRLGMLLYDLLSYNKTMPWHERLSRADVRDREPALPTEGLQGGYVYHDRRVEFVERLCLETVLSAAQHGADVLNHAESTDLRVVENRVRGITVRDRLAETTFDVESATVVNAAGPSVDAVLGGYIDEQYVRPTKGIHLVVPSLTTHALTLPTTDDRIIFVVPWNGMSLIGTTDTDFSGDPTQAVATPDDVAYLLYEAGRFFPDLEADDVLYTYAGVRPLYDSGDAQAASSVSRRHRVVDHGEEIAGLFSLVGAKITAYRHAAADLMDAVAAYLETDAPCRTDELPLPGARGGTDEDLDCSPQLRSHLETLYGTRAEAVLSRIDRNPQLGEPLCAHTDDVLAQVNVAVEEEFARTLADVMLRRCTVGFEACEGRDAVQTVSRHMANLLEWEDDRVEAERDRYETILARRHVDPAAQASDASSNRSSG